MCYNVTLYHIICIINPVFYLPLMKLLPYLIAYTAISSSFATLFAADVDITFDGAAGTTIGSTGSETGSWSQDDLTLGDGTLNIGITALNQSESVNTSTANLNTYALTDALSEGVHTFEVVISDFDFTKSSSDYVGTVLFDAGFSISDSNGNSAKIGLKNYWDFEANGYLGGSKPIIYSEDSGYSSLITDVEILESGRQENGASVPGSAQNPSLINGASPIVLQIEVDLDNGSWAASAKIGNGAVIDLTTNGTGITDIASFSIENSYDNTSQPSSNWGTFGGPAANYVQVDNISLKEFVAAPEAVSGSDITITGSKFGNSSDESFGGSTVSQQIGNSSQASTEPIKFQIIVDPSNGQWTSNASISSGGTYGDPIPLVTDGTGITDVASFSIVTVQPTDSSESWGLNATNDASGDSVKVDSINISTLSGTSIVSANFDDVVGTQLDQVAVTSGENTLNFNYPGHLTDGTGNLINVAPIFKRI